jgi:polyhydroxybutyrate depolymerase
VRSILVIAALALFAPSAVAAPGGTVSRGSVQDEGVTRTYRVFVPTRLQQPAPIVLVFHGGFGTGAGAARLTGFDAVAEKRGFIAVYPDGIGRTWNAGLCCGAADRLDLDDAGFVSRLLDKLRRQYSIDKRRVFATGISNGGLFSYVLACRLSGRIAAAAPVAATLDSDCSPSKPVSILHVHGLDDENIPFAGGSGPRGAVSVDWPPARAGIDRWRTLDGCPTTDTTRVNGSITTRSWSPCHRGTEVRLVTVAGVAHAWPREPYDATAEIWRFFAAHPKR